MRGLGDHLSIGERITFYRKRRGYTQEVLAGLVGRSTDWLANAESGRRKPPRIDMLAELARTLRVPLGDIVGQSMLVSGPCAWCTATTTAPSKPRSWSRQDISTSCSTSSPRSDRPAGTLNSCEHQLGTGWGIPAIEAEITQARETRRARTAGAQPRSRTPASPRAGASSSRPTSGTGACPGR